MTIIILLEIFIVVHKLINNMNIILLYVIQ
jgi:hypothetical protein